jgi:hypothetical protein
VIYPVIMWVDPGKMTGLAWLLGGVEFHADEYGFDAAADRIEHTCRRYGPTLAIGWERYTILASMPQTDAAHAIEMIGVTRRYARRGHCHILPEAAQHTPGPFDRKVLETLGWWVKGRDDAQSAAAHMLRYLMRSGTLPPRVSAAVSEASGTV